MNAFRQLVGIQARRTMREPAAVFFMLAFAPMFAVAMGLIFGNEPVAQFGGRGYLDANLVSFTAIIVVILGLIIVPVDILSQRDSGALRRFRATPLRPGTYVAADVLVRFVISLTSIVVMLAIGILAFGARPEGNLGSVLLVAALGVVVFLAVGYALAAVLPSQGVGQALGNILVFPLIFLSGAAVPLDVLPDDVRRVAQVSPLTQLVELLRGLWDGQPWSEQWVPVVVLLGLLAVAGVVASRFFRWE
ncbi:ABC transporter permease [Actinotalea sp. K2]|uniref:ABC transporter permease n=1 Tax=Actinotalea sp. K2 TaxID=2939438 RepID=UPI002016C26A|nr:ABC transporter permease [Actinotalea sp. K2]MCL3861003.1 ABC transporter permease [Actinotalea sp. K2]